VRQILGTTCFQKSSMSNAILEETALPVAAQLATTNASKDVISHGELNLSTGDQE
jgi:hypothetical protein